LIFSGYQDQEITRSSPVICVGLECTDRLGKQISDFS
jgi:hypothetical protein